MTPEPYLSVGEVDDDRIGCYLFGIEATPMSPISYHSVATSPAELIADCTSFFEEFADAKERLMSTSPNSARHKQDLKVIRNAIDNLPSFVALHLASNMTTPFLKVANIEIFLRTGMRQREKINGSYIE
jgi:hypothetical protein